ncbi:MAG TPA: DUF4404 family protein [Anaerolineales bacterium]|nr:DUF4404 family protein [Anaerolineales bacterium]
MIENKLTELLLSLQKELSKSETLDKDSVILLKELVEDINEILDQDKPKTEEDESFIGRLEDGMTRFEVTHPELVSTINKVLESLSNAGI